jgi:hypothetical protein
MVGQALTLTAGPLIGLSLCGKVSQATWPVAM